LNRQFLLVGVCARAFFSSDFGFTFLFFLFLLPILVTILLPLGGSVGAMRGLAGKCDVNGVEASTGRTALHKAAFWGHIEAVTYLLGELKLNVNAVDVEGDTALHDAARFGHAEVVRSLLAHSPDVSIRNNDGHDALAIAIEYQKPEIVALLRSRSKL
jgi:Ankyrin repeats (3 copies)/Ankyrin repeats (many copies)